MGLRRGHRGGVWVICIWGVTQMGDFSSQRQLNINNLNQIQSLHLLRPNYYFRFEAAYEVDVLFLNLGIYMHKYETMNFHSEYRSSFL